MSDEIFFLGLDRIGASIGMALGETEIEMTRVGYDPDRRRARAALDAGAVDRLVPHPRNAPKTAMMVVIDTPVIDVRDYLEMLGKNLQPDGIVINTTLCKTAAASWAAEILPNDRHYIGATPIVGPAAFLSEVSDPVMPRNDLFRGGLMALTIPPNTQERAVTATLNLTAVLGATPFFLDPMEHDGINAAVEALPRLIGAAMMQLAARSPNWREIQRMAGSVFATPTSLVTPLSTTEHRTAMTLNRGNILAKLDALMAELQDLRALIEEDNDEALENYLAEAAMARDSWLSYRQKGDWADQEVSVGKLPSRGSFFGNLLGIKRRDKKESP